MELAQQFDDDRTNITSDDTFDPNLPLIVSVATNLSKIEADAIFSLCLNGLDLFGKKL
ncbi:hypothetical protein [Noviluteimonas dokdonensis]|uniref:hypothetical protein n=1 Tax=Noviluteimonas dokdonensis TaxID=414050 RepID=UPI001376C9D2|nr:hypothetical protein [Lysobacter dokdonensis]